MLSVGELVARLTPSSTVLLLGAGAAVSSGAPTGDGLAGLLNDRVDPAKPVEGSLSEVAGILELRHGRHAVIDALRSILTGLKPTGGLLALPEFDWHGIYTTNFDFLIERSFERAKRPLAVSKSNFDYSNVERNPDATPLYKIHGCLSSDLVDGHKARIVLTEEDYEQYGDFREVLFKKLDLDLTSHDLLVVGHSLKDVHIKNYLDQALRLQQDKSAPGRVFVLSYTPDEERATLLERRGVQVSFGSIDDLMSELTDAQAASTDAVESVGDTFLAASLLPKSVSARDAARHRSNPLRLFNGSSATYADITAGLTFKREIEPQIAEAITHRNCITVALLGAGGVGKTTLARRLMMQLTNLGYETWEHNPNFPFLKDEWLRVESALRENGRYGVLLVDDCSPVLSQINPLVTELARRDDPALIVFVTSNTSSWKPRTKSPVFYTHGETFELSKLSDSDLNELLNLVEGKAEISRLISTQFSSQSRSQRFSLLRRRCGAEMYVCLKNVFATESLDNILLREFAEMPEHVQDVYRLVAAVEATGAQVHRQLVLRLLQVDSGTVQGLLDVLEGVVDEFDIRPSIGIYGLSTRHRVIAQTITRYKYADQSERANLFADIIDGLNPTVFLELKLAREICDREFGIVSLSDRSIQVKLLKQLVDRVPAERIPRHRLIGAYIVLGELDLAEQEVTDAMEAVGIDPPLARYRVTIMLRRAIETTGIMHEDRYALLLQAKNLAERAIVKYPNDPYAYTSNADVALAIAELTDDAKHLDEALRDLEDGFDRLREPNMREALRRFRDSRKSFV